MLLNLLITLITCCIRQIENPSHSFNFLPANIALCRVDCARRPLSGAGLAERKSSSLRCGIFFCQALRKKAIQGPEAYKIGKTHPDGIIHS